MPLHLTIFFIFAYAREGLRERINAQKKEFYNPETGYLNEASGLFEEILEECSQEKAE